MQVLFFEQEKGSKETGNKLLLPPELIRNHTPTIGDDQGKLKLGLDEKSSRGESTRRTITPAGNTEKDQNKMKRSDGKLPLELEKKLIIAEIEETESEKGKEIRGEGMSRSKLDPKRIITKGSRSDNSRDKGRDR